MTKLKNTKKGMAKKALSISLVAAMLATSNVPVWAAEFTDGSDAAVEAPVVEEAAVAADDFTAEAVEETAETPATKSTETGNKEYTATITPFTVGDVAIANNETEWGGRLSTNLTVTENTAIAGGTLKAAWKKDGKVIDGTVGNITNTHKCYYDLTADLAGSEIALYVYVETSEGEVAWSYTSDAVTVQAKDVSKIVKASVTNPTYSGEDQKPQATLSWVTGAPSTGDAVALADINNYDVAYSGELVNVGGKATVTLTPNPEKLKGYSGQFTATYEIQPMELSTNDAIASRMTATLKNTSYLYTGNKETKVKKSDITLVDEKTGEDLSSYLRADKDGYVDISFTSAAVGTKEKIAICLINGQPESGNKNYKIADKGTLAYPVVKSDNVMTIAARDLSTVTATVPNQKYTGTKVVIAPTTVKFVDSNTQETLNLGSVTVTVPDNAIDRGEGYVATIKPADGNKNITGSVTGTFSIYSESLDNAEFWIGDKKVDFSGKSYTGEAVTFSKEELGDLWIGDKKIEPSDYEISYLNNTNAGKATLIVKGKNSYLGSSKKFEFDISAASLSEVKAEENVELITGATEKDYKDAMGVVVKATNKDGKEFTLTESADYKVEYAFNTKNEAGQKVKATVTITNPNFKGTTAVSNTVESTIVAALLKDEYIKLKETAFTYNGQPAVPAFDVVIDGKVKDPSLFKASYSDNIEAGTATLKVTAKDPNTYSGTATVTYTINPAAATDLKGVIATEEYRGYSIEIPADEIDLTLDGNKIDVASNFTLTYGENLNVGEGTVTLTPKNGNFTGTKTLTFQICGKLLDAGGTFKHYDKNGFEVKSKKFDYDGTAHTFAKTEFTYSGAEKLKEGIDYEIKYVDNVYGKDVNGTQKGAILVIAKGKYGASGVYTDAEGNKYTNVIATDTFEITSKEFKESNVSIANGVYAGGLPVKPEVSIIVNGTKLVEDKDYTLDVSDNTDLVNATSAKTLKVTIKGKNGYAGSLIENAKWGIDKFNLANADTSVKDGKLVVKCGKVDVDASEYTAKVNDADGTTTITAVESSKNYTGSKTFRTNGETEGERPEAPVITDVKVSGNKATVILEGETEGATGYDYVISTENDYKNGRLPNGINKNQLVTQTSYQYLDQGIYYAYCHAWKKVNGKKVFSGWSNIYPFAVTSITPSKPVVTNVKVSGSTVSVTYTKSANATGYDLVLGKEMKKVNGEMRPVNYGKLVKKVTNGNTVTATFTKVPKGTYYVGLHAYNRTSENGTKVFSPWSNAKKITVK